ncbi:MAG: TetR/AcrR family transcriptional regulator [Coriobacteriia bacterium]
MEENVDSVVVPEPVSGVGTVRERILDAALRLFVDKGFHHTSMPDIVRASGTSVGAVYHHFGSKDELARVLHRQLVDQFVGIANEEVLTLEGARARIRGYTAMLFRLTEENRYFVSYLIFTRPAAVVEDNLTVCSREGLEVTRHIVADGRKTGEIREIDDRVLCGLISGSIMRLIDLRLDGVIAEPLTGLVDDTTDAIWGGVAT